MQKLWVETTFVFFQICITLKIINTEVLNDMMVEYLKVHKKRKTTFLSNQSATGKHQNLFTKL